MSAGMATLGSGPSIPKTLAAFSRTLLSLSRSSSMSAGMASLPAGPIFLKVMAAEVRTFSSLSRSSSVSAGMAGGFISPKAQTAELGISLSLSRASSISAGMATGPIFPRAQMAELRTSLFLSSLSRASSISAEMLALAARRDFSIDGGSSTGFGLYCISKMGNSTILFSFVMKYCTLGLYTSRLPSILNPTFGSTL